MKYLSYQPERPWPPCPEPDTTRLPDPDTTRLVVTPDSERPVPNCPLQLTEKTPTGDLYHGEVVDWRWEGLGSLTLPSGVRYEGEFEDGRFHGTGALLFPTGSRYEGQWERGVCTGGLYTFADGLTFSERDWRYCLYPDRRYWSEVRRGLRPAGRSQVSDSDPPREVPPGLLDAGDGLYDPKSRTVYDYADPKKIRRVVTDEDHLWMTARCRRGGDSFMERREELHTDLAPLAFRARQSKPPAAVPEPLRLADILAPPPPDPRLVAMRERGAELVREVVRRAELLAGSARGIVSGAAGRAVAVQEEARAVVDAVQSRAGSATSIVSTVMEEASRKLSDSDWTSSSDTEGSAGRRRHRSGGSGRSAGHGSSSSSTFSSSGSGRLRGSRSASDRSGGSSGSGVLRSGSGSGRLPSGSGSGTAPRTTSSSGDDSSPADGASQQ